VDQGLTRKGTATPTDPAGGAAATPGAGQPGAGNELHPEGPDPAGLPPDTGGRLPGQESGKSQGEKLGR
jgi:hypothetical protein